MIVLAFDIAKQTGWCLGRVGVKVPEFGSFRFASRTASHEAIFADAILTFSRWTKFLRPDRIVYEEPLQFRGRASRKGNDEILYGLPAIMQGVAHLRGIYDVRCAAPREVRNFVLGSNPKRDVAKKATIHRCKLLGWDVPDDNAADACALWLYSCSFLDPKQSIRPTPLFSGRASLAKETTNNGD